MSVPFADRPLVYIAAAYTSAPEENTHKAVAVADDLQSTGLVACVVPHLNLLWTLIHPHDGDYWYDHDLALLARCDALLRLPGESPGADNEVAFARNHDIPVFLDKAGLLEWAPHELHRIKSGQHQ